MPYGLFAFSGGLYLNPWYLGLIIASFVIGSLAQYYINKTYATWSLQKPSISKSGAHVAREMMEAAGINDVHISHISGKLTDNFNPRKKTLNLSEENFSGGSVASIAVACHEAGHAVQTAKNYFPVKVRTAMVPVVGFTAQSWFYVFLAGVLLNIGGLITLSIFFFAVTLIFQLVTLPVEFDASRRALRYIESSGQFSSRTLQGAKQVLIAAALTYLASALISSLQLIYLLNQKAQER